MSILNIFSKRQRRARGEVPDVYRYDDLPESLRVQVVHIWSDTLGNREQYDDQYRGYQTKSAYEFIANALCREYGLFRLAGNSHYPRHFHDELVSFLLEEKNVERAMDAIELSFRVINTATRNYEFLKRDDGNKRADDATAELNARLLEHGVGYQFEGGEIVRVDSEFIHKKVVMPALKLLTQAHLAGAQDEFLRAHEHYRKGNTKESLNEALKAFESTLKGICKRRGWAYPEDATSKTLVDICYKKGLVPSFWQSHMSAIRALLEAGVPPARNRLGGHGQGPDPVDVPTHIVGYALHMTAAAIVFLAQADESGR